MSSLILLIFVILITPCLVACAVSADISLTASSKLKLLRLQREGNASAIKVLKLQDNIGSVSASIHLFETIIQTLSTTFATTLISNMFPEVGSHIHVAIVTLIFTFMVVTYGDILPVIYVYSNPEPVALFYSRYLWIWYRWTGVFTSCIEKLAMFSLKFMRIKINDKKNYVDLDELRTAIDLHGGEKVSYEKTILQSILELRNIDVSDIMIHRNKMISVNIEDTVLNIIQTITNSSHTRIPVWKNHKENIIGVLHTKDLAQRLVENHDIDHSIIKNIMIEPSFIPDTTSLLLQMQRFREKRSHIAFVVDEYGSLQGMVTLEDILEEMVGEILDEHDENISTMRITKNGDYIVSGDTTIRDFNRYYNLHLPEMDNVSTIAGLVLETSKNIPDVGDIFEIEKFKIKILKMSKHKILLVQINIRK